MTQLTLGSLFAGIGGFDLAAERAGMAVRWQVEIDPFCNRVLARHWPDVRRYGDIQVVDGAALEPVDVMSGGFPCQGLSVAGRRAGLSDPRSGLFFDLVRIIQQMREATHGSSPTWVVLENVPGLLSSQRGRDFAVVLHELAELGPADICWRILDARFFGVPQRRRRVFFVLDFGGERAAQVLFEPAGGGGDSTAGREERASLARPVAGGPAYALRAGRSLADAEGNEGNNVALVPPDLAYTLAAGRGAGRLQHEQTYVPVLSPVLHREGHDASEDGTDRRALVAFLHVNKGRPNGRASSHTEMVTVKDHAPTLTTDGLQQSAIAFAWQQGDDSKYGKDGRGRSWMVRAGDYAGASSATRQDAVAYGFDHTQDPVSEQDAVPTLNHDGQAVAFQCHGGNVGPLGTLREENGGLIGGVPFVAAPLMSGGHPHSTVPGRHREDDENLIVVNGNSTPEVRANEALALRHNDATGNRQWVSGHGTMIRRLTPTEGERLQGFLDGFTCLCGADPYSTAACRCPDTPRYAVLGNAVNRVVAEWILCRLAAVARGARP